MIIWGRYYQSIFPVARFVVLRIRNKTQLLFNKHLILALKLIKTNLLTSIYITL